MLTVRLGVTIEDMDALFARPVAKTVLAGLRGRPLPLAHTEIYPDVDGEKEAAQATYIETQTKS